MCEQQSTCGYLSVFIVVGLGSSVKRNVLRKRQDTRTTMESVVLLSYTLLLQSVCVLVVVVYLSLCVPSPTLEFFAYLRT